MVRRLLLSAAVVVAMSAASAGTAWANSCEQIRRIAQQTEQAYNADRRANFEANYKKAAMNNAWNAYRACVNSSRGGGSGGGGSGGGGSSGFSNKAQLFSGFMNIMSTLMTAAAYQQQWEEEKRLARMAASNAFQRMNQLEQEKIMRLELERINANLARQQAEIDREFRAAQELQRRQNPFTDPNGPVIAGLKEGQKDRELCQSVLKREGLSETKRCPDNLWYAIRNARGKGNNQIDPDLSTIYENEYQALAEGKITYEELQRRLLLGLGVD